MWQTITVIALLVLCVAFLARHFWNKYRRISGTGSSCCASKDPGGPSLPMAGPPPGPDRLPRGRSGE